MPQGNVKPIREPSWRKMVLKHHEWREMGVDTLPGIVQDGGDYLIKTHASFFASSVSLLMLAAVKLLSAKENLGLTKTCLLVSCKEADGQASWERWLSSHSLREDGP